MLIAAARTAAATLSLHRRRLGGHELLRTLSGSEFSVPAALVSFSSGDYPVPGSAGHVRAYPSRGLSGY